MKIRHQNNSVGKGVLAEKILESKGKEIPVVEDSNLVEELVKLSIGSEILLNYMKWLLKCYLL